MPEQAARVQVALTASYGVGYRARVPDQGKSHRARARLCQLAAGLAIALLAPLHTGAAPTAAAVPSPGTTQFLDHGGPVLHTAHIYLLYWGSHWPATGIYFPTPAQITAAFHTVLAGPYLSGLAQYRGIQPAVLRGSMIVTTSNPRNGFNEHDVANFVNTQLDAGVVPGPDPDNQSLYIVVMPVGISAGGYFYVFDGEHYYYERDGRRIRVVWTADSGSLDGATRIMSHELVESITDPEGSAVHGTSSTCEQSGWCEIADVCFDTSLVNGVAVSPYWSEHAHACVAPIRPAQAVRQSRARIRRGDGESSVSARRCLLRSARSQAGTSLAHNRGRRPVFAGAYIRGYAAPRALKPVTGAERFEQVEALLLARFADDQPARGAPRQALASVGGEAACRPGLEGRLPRLHRDDVGQADLQPDYVAAAV